MHVNKENFLKRTYTQRFRKALLAQKDFLIQKLQEDLDRAQRRDEKNKAPVHAEDPSVVMTKIVTALAASGGALTAVAISPEIFALVGRMARNKIFFPRAVFKKSIAYLARKKFVRILRTHYGYRMRSTERGRDRILALSYSRLRVKKIHPWDGVWRMVLFDVPNTQHWAREALRSKLKAMDFCRIQKSVFVSPHPCEREIRMIAGLLGIEKHIRIVETASLGDEHELKRHFLV